jgi:hypothetical protein
LIQALARIAIYSFIVLAVQSYRHYDRKTFIVQATGSKSLFIFGFLDRATTSRIHRCHVIQAARQVGLLSQSLAFSTTSSRQCKRCLTSRIVTIQAKLTSDLGRIKNVRGTILLKFLQVYMDGRLSRLVCLTHRPTS